MRHGSACLSGEGGVAAQERGDTGACLSGFAEIIGLEDVRHARPHLDPDRHARGDRLAESLRDLFDL